MRPATVRSALTSLPCRSTRRRPDRARCGQRGHASSRTYVPLTGLAVGLLAGLGLGATAGSVTGDDRQPVRESAATHESAMALDHLRPDQLDRPAPGSRAGRSTTREAPRTAVADTRIEGAPAGQARADAGGRTDIPASVASLDWDALAECESDGDAGAVSPVGYAGLYQFDDETWHSVGGEGEPNEASAAEQTYRAQLLYTRRGASPWPSCGHLL